MNQCFCAILPEHLLKAIAQNGDPHQRAWAVQTLAVSARLRGRREVLATVPVDAPSIVGEKRRTIFSANQTESLPGTLVRSEGSTPSSDATVNEAYDGAGHTYDLFSQVFKRNSLDDKGLRLDSTVHFSRGYDNAFWDGRQMVYGDGDGKLFNRFTIALDVIGHEFTHGVTQYEAGLAYWEQPGALNESMSDVFGSLVKQRALKQDFAQADWLIGAGLLTARVKGVALRSMKTPGSAYNDPVLGKDPQPGHMRKYVQTNEDNGGCHINSGIPNRAFYLVAEQLKNSFRAGHIWYVALRDRLRSRTNFREAANIITNVARELYGAKSKEQTAVRKAWGAVGLLPR